MAETIMGCNIRKLKKRLVKEEKSRQAFMEKVIQLAKKGDPEAQEYLAKKYQCHVWTNQEIENFFKGI